MNVVIDSNGGFDVQRVVGGGSYAGANVGYTVNLEITNADTVEQLTGPGYQVGGNAGQGFVFEGSAFGGSGYQGVSVGLGVGGGLTPGAGFGYYTHTSSFFSDTSILCNAR